MRLSVDHQSPFYVPHLVSSVDIYIDGELATGVVEASEEHGWALCNKKDDAGRTILRVNEACEREIDREVRRGTVEIRVRAEFLERSRRQRAHYARVLREMADEIERGSVHVIGLESERRVGPARQELDERWLHVEPSQRFTTMIDLFRPAKEIKVK
jgi:hypothetical protein